MPLSYVQCVSLLPDVPWDPVSVARGAPIPPVQQHSLVPLSPLFAQCMTRALQPDPQHRFRTARDFRAALLSCEQQLLRQQQQVNSPSVLSGGLNAVVRRGAKASPPEQRSHGNSNPSNVLANATPPAGAILEVSSSPQQPLRLPDTVPKADAASPAMDSLLSELLKPQSHSPLDVAASASSTVIASASDEEPSQHRRRRQVRAAAVSSTRCSRILGSPHVSVTGHNIDCSGATIGNIGTDRERCVVCTADLRFQRVSWRNLEHDCNGCRHDAGRPFPAAGCRSCTASAVSSSWFTMNDALHAPTALDSRQRAWGLSSVTTQSPTVDVDRQVEHHRAGVDSPISRL